MSGAVDAPAGARHKRVGFLELLFDLVFVFAVTQLVATLHHDHSASGWAHAGLLLWLVWWAWSQYTWAGNAIELDRRPVRVVVLAVTGLMLVAAMAIPEAFAARGAWFALPYVAVRVAGLALYWAGLRDEPEHRAALRTFLPVALASAALVLAGGLAPAGARPWWWAAALVVDVASVISAGRGEFRVDAAHFAERHGLIVIIALGESVIALGATAAELEPTAGVLGAVTVGFATVAVLWWSYFDWVAAAVERRLATEPDHRSRGHLARDLFTLGHLPIVAGTVAFAAGIEEVVAHPDEPLAGFGAVALGAGPVLFLAGFVIGNYRAAGRLLVERAVAMVAVATVVAGLAERVDALLTAAAVGAVVAAAVAAEWGRRSSAVTPG